MFSLTSQAKKQTELARKREQEAKDLLEVNQRLSEEQQCETIGGGDLRSAWSTFTDNLHFGDFSMGSGLLTFSISFVPMLLFNVIRTGYRAAETIYNKLSARFGYQDETLTAFQQYTDEMRNKHQKNNA